MTKHLHRDLSTTNQKNRPFGLWIGQKRYNVGTCLRHVSNVLIQWWLVIERNMPDFVDYRVANWWPM